MSDSYGVQRSVGQGLHICYRTLSCAICSDWKILCYFPTGGERKPSSRPRLAGSTLLEEINVRQPLAILNKADITDIMTRHGTLVSVNEGFPPRQRSRGQRDICPFVIRLLEVIKETETLESPMSAHSAMSPCCYLMWSDCLRQGASRVAPLQLT